MKMAIKKIEEPIQTKWERIYEDEDCVSIWKYNSKITTNGPVEVEYRWKRSFNPWGDNKKKTIGELSKETKKRLK
jgi:hypothetical protein